MSINAPEMGTIVGSLSSNARYGTILHTAPKYISQSISDNCYLKSNILCMSFVSELLSVYI